MDVVIPLLGITKAHAQELCVRTFTSSTFCDGENNENTSNVQQNGES